jgi:DNA-binding CsgD family transcriptional regulator
MHLPLPPTYLERSGPRLTTGQQRQLILACSVIRWPGLAFVLIVGLLVPPRSTLVLVLFTVFAAAYNLYGWQASRRAPDSALPRVARALWILDELSCFALLAIFGAANTEIIYVCFILLLMEAVAVDGAEGGMLAATVFVVGVVAYEGISSTLMHKPFAGTRVVLWSIVITVAAGVLGAFDRILVVPPQPQPQPVRPEITPAPGPSPEPSVRLTAREQQVLELVAEGYSNTMIATRLHLSENTVKTYMETLLTRFNARNRAEAVAAASRLNIL